MSIFNKIIFYVLGVFSLVLCVGTLFLSHYSTSLGTLYTKTSGNPSEIVSLFYDSIENQQYDEAYACLAEYNNLGLNVEDSYDESITQALQSSYKYKLVGDFEINDLSATGLVSFTYLDINSVKEQIEKEIEPILESYVETLTRKELYDENGEYLPSLLDQVYLDAKSKVLKDVEPYKKTVEYPVELKYIGSTWKILTNDSMLNCFVGGKNI